MIVSQGTTVYTNLESMHKFLGCARKGMERGRKRGGGVGREKGRVRDDSESLDEY